MHNEIDVIKQTEDTLKAVDKVVQKEGKTVFRRYPLIFSLLATFGVAAIFYGFEEVIGKIPFLKDHPMTVFIIGVLLLLFTGQLYKRLADKPSKHE